MRVEYCDKVASASGGSEKSAASSQQRKNSLAGAVATGAAESVVLKFGSSVLHSPADLPSAVTEIYRHVRAGRKVVAVVSAFAGETDRLIAEAAATGAARDSRNAPRLIGLGEERSAALLAISCEAVGLNVRVCGARALALRAAGPPDDAHPESVDGEALRRELEIRDVVIAPGFVALGSSGELVLLGRGGSDLTAVVLASALGAAEAVLVKDVDGVYDRDPASAENVARRFERLNYEEAQRVAGKLLQPKAIAFAEAHDIALIVRRLNAGGGTRVAREKAALAAVAPPRRLRVAVAGLGVIGESAALRLAANEEDYALCGVLVRDKGKKRDAKLASVPVYADVGALLATSPDIIVDALPDGVAGRTLIEAALQNGVSVVTANKQAIAGAMAALTRCAAENAAAFRYSPSVGGGVPMVECVRRARAQGPVETIAAALNGTVNFILSATADGVPFDEAVKAAQAAGFAEPDPTADLSGADARAKLSILSFVAFGREIPLADIKVEALDAARVAAFQQTGGVYRQVSRLSLSASGAPQAALSFERVDDDTFFSAARGEANAMRLRLADGRIFETRGKGAGRSPTVESIFGDLGEIRRAVLQR